MKRLASLPGPHHLQPLQYANMGGGEGLVDLPTGKSPLMGTTPCVSTFCLLNDTQVSRSPRHSPPFLHTTSEQRLEVVKATYPVFHSGIRTPLMQGNSCLPLSFAMLQFRPSLERMSHCTSPSEGTRHKANCSCHSQTQNGDWARALCIMLVMSELAR